MAGSFAKGFLESFNRAVILITACALLSACGGGGGGDGGSNPPPVGPGDTEKFFPDSVGDTWFYDATSGDPAVAAMHEHGFSQLSVTGTRAFGSTVAKIFTTTSPDDPGPALETYYSKDSNGVTNHGNNDPADTLTPAVVPYLEGKFPVTPGVITNISRSGVDFGEDLDGDGRREKVDFTLRITMDGFEALTVPAGSFGRTARRTSTIDGTVRTTRSGSFPFTAAEQLWSAPGVGVVKQLMTVSAGGGLPDQQSYVARGYKVDGVAHGMGLPGAFATGLVAEGTSVPAAASDGNDGFMLAAVRQTSDSPITSKIVAAFGDADGKLVREVDVTSPTPGYMVGRAIDVAFDGTDYLLLYSNGTSNATPNPLLAMRITPNGVVLDPAGFEIDEGSVWMAAVAHGSSNYLVVFSRYDDASGRHQLYGRLVTSAGNVVGASEFPIGPRDQNQLYADVAFDGTNFLVVWQQQPFTGSDPPDITVVAARVSETGVVLDPNGFAVSSTGRGSYTPRVAFGHGQYLVVWVDLRYSANYTEGADIYAARVDTNGVLVDGPVATGGLRISGDKMPEAGYPRAVYTGSEFLVTWSAYGIYAPTPESGIFGARVSQAGAVNRGGKSYGIALSGEPTSSPYAHSTPLRLGSRYVLTWVDGTSVRDLPIYSLE